LKYRYSLTFGKADFIHFINPAAGVREPFFLITRNNSCKGTLGDLPALYAALKQEVGLEPNQKDPDTRSLKEVGLESNQKEAGTRLPKEVKTPSFRERVSRTTSLGWRRHS